VAASSQRRVKVLAVASSGGHWVQLMRLAPAFDDADVVFVTVDQGYATQVGESSFRVVPNVIRRSRWLLLKCFLVILRVVACERPDVVVSTGSAPGYFAIRIGKWFGARTMWIDSIANAEELSHSGKQALRHADVCLTQWAHLAQPDGPYHRGAVL